MKIALIAMSGIRVYNEELNRLGMTLPGFVERGRVIASLPSLSLLTLAGATPDDFDVEYYEIDELEALDRLPDCDLAAVSTFTARAKDAYRVAERYRKQGVRTVLGGLHATARPQEALRFFDSVVVGEAETTWPRLLADLRSGHPRRLYTPRGEFDLAEAPMPRFDLLDIERYNRLTVQTQRGCPWRCEFCASSITLTQRYKVKPIAKVLAEIHEIKRLWPHPFIEFADDNSFVNRRHAKELMRALAPEGIRWFTETDVAIADDPELLTLMREAGCAQVLIGLESPTSAGLDGIELQRDWKRSQVDGYKAAVETIQSHGVAVNGCFVLGLDGQTTAVFDDVWRFVQDSGLRDVQITVMTAFPGTTLYDRLRAQDRLIDPEAWEKRTLFDVHIRPEGMTVEELEHGIADLARVLYSAEAKRDRERSFRAQMRRSIQKKGESESHAHEQISPVL